MGSETLTRKQLDEMIFLALKEHETPHLPIGPFSFKGLFVGGMREIYDFLESPEIKKHEVKRPKCPITPETPNMGSKPRGPYKMKIAGYIRRICGVDIEYPSCIPISVLEAIANYADSRG